MSVCVCVCVCFCRARETRTEKYLLEISSFKIVFIKLLFHCLFPSFLNPMNGKWLTKCARGSRHCRRNCNKQKWVRAHLTILKRYFISDETETIKFCLHIHFLGNFLLLLSLTDLQSFKFYRKKRSFFPIQFYQLLSCNNFLSFVLF